MLASFVEIYEPVADEKGQTVSAEIGAALRVRGDKELLVQMFSNLVENAVCHAPQGARIAVSAHRRDDCIAVEIADDGPGIPAAQREKVFQRFYRIEPSRAPGGNGLGLSIVAAICALHAIDITLADNRPGLKVLLACPAQ